MPPAIVPVRRWSALIFLAVGLGVGLYFRPSRMSPPIIATAGAAEELPADDPADSDDLGHLQDKFQSVAKRVAPTVVAISAAETASASDASFRTIDLNGPRLQDILDKTTRTVGTGFIFDSNGFILTNQHVIEEAEQYWVTTDDHKVYPALVVGADPRSDLAVLKIPARNLPTATFATDCNCQRGAWAVTLGNPFGLATEGEMSLSVGVISATGLSLPKLARKENRLYTNLLQTTAQINPGNSGGPLLDVDGNVIGINTAVILPQKQTNGIGFAMPVTPQLLAEARELAQGHEIIYGYIGVGVTIPSSLQRRAAGLDDTTGLLVDSVDIGSPAADDNGLKEGDILVEYDGQMLRDSDQFVRLVSGSVINHPKNIHIIRDTKPVSLTLTPIKRPVQEVVSSENQRFYWHGMALGPIPTDWPAARGLKHLAGILVVAIETDSPLRKQGIIAGSVINSVAGRPVTSLIDLQEILNDVPPEKCEVTLASLSGKS
jgi:serine protease Do